MGAPSGVGDGSVTEVMLAVGVRVGDVVAVGRLVAASELMVEA